MRTVGSSISIKIGKIAEQGMYSLDVFQDCTCSTIIFIVTSSMLQKIYKKNIVGVLMYWSIYFT